jgi:hypothetical protein
LSFHIKRFSGVETRYKKGESAGDLEIVSEEISYMEVGSGNLAVGKKTNSGPPPLFKKFISGRVNETPQYPQ